MAWTVTRVACSRLYLYCQTRKECCGRLLRSLSPGLPAVSCVSGGVCLFWLQASLPTYSQNLLENPGLVYASHEAKRLALNLEHEKRAVLACKRDFRCGVSAAPPSSSFRIIKEIR